VNVEIPRGAAGDRLLRHGWRSWVLLYAAWTGPALLTGLSAFAIQHATDPSTPLGRTLLQQVWYFWVFATICPLVYHVNVRLPFTRTAWPRAVAAHVALGLAVSLATMVIAGVLDVAIGIQDRTIPRAIVVELTTPRGQFRGVVNVFYYVMVVALMALVRADRRRREQEDRAATLEAQVARARLRALEMQLQPHFLFNALNGIASLVTHRRTDDAYAAIVALGELLRATIRADDRPSIPLRRELELLEKYLAIERLRFPDRLGVEVRVDAESAGAAVPQWILQPLVENAIRHALAAEPGAHQLSISGRIENGRLSLEVRDDGPGFPPGFRIGGGPGVGLANVRDRLAALYGDRAMLSVDRVGERGASARIVLPHEPYAPASEESR
jgi:signal transduction histidine kinase